MSKNSTPARPFAQMPDLAPSTTVSVDAGAAACLRRATREALLGGPYDPDAFDALIEHHRALTYHAVTRRAVEHARAA